jgi:hypothetical protein
MILLQTFIPTDDKGVKTHYTHLFPRSIHCLYGLLFTLLSAFALGDAVTWNAWKEETLEELPSIPGWCSREKASKIMDFLYKVRPKQCVEIGAFCGSTTYPMVRSLQYLRMGKLWAIDAWDYQKAIEGLDPHSPDAIWWSKVDMKACFSAIHNLIARKQLTKWCRIVQSTSQKVLSSFPDESIDFIYIDGSFSSESALHDAILSYRKAKKGGYIWLNDSHCAPKLESVAYLMERCSWIQEYSLSNQSIVFKKE